MAVEVPSLLHSALARPDAADSAKDVQIGTIFIFLSEKNLDIVRNVNSDEVEKNDSSSCSQAGGDVGVLSSITASSFSPLFNTY